MAKRVRQPKHSRLRYSELTPRQKSAYDRASRVLARMRKGESFRDATDAEHIDRRTARKYLGRDVLGESGERLRPAKGDRRVRELQFLTDGARGYETVAIRGKKDANLASIYSNDVGKLIHGKMSESDFQRKWLGVRIGKKTVLADIERIREMVSAGEIKIDSLYRPSKGGAR